MSREFEIEIKRALEENNKALWHIYGVAKSTASWLAFAVSCFLFKYILPDWYDYLLGFFD